MNIRSLLYVAVLIISIVVFHHFAKFPLFSKSQIVDASPAINNYLPLNRDFYTEHFIKENILVGMSIADVEAKLGKPYDYTDFMDTKRACYFLDFPKDGMNIIDYTMVYKNGLLTNIDVTWMYSNK